MNDALNIMIGSVVSAGEDLVLALLPAVLVWSMQIPTRTKIGIWLLFSLSIGTSAIGFVRAYIMWQGLYNDQKDWIYHLYWTWLLAMLEVACGLICSSVPALKPFCKHFAIEQKVRGFFKLTSRKTSTAKPRLLPNETVDNSSSGIFDGTLTSIAEVTWVSRPKSIRGSRIGKSQTRKHPASVVEEELHELRALAGNDEDNMCINVRQSITIDRETAYTRHLAYTPYDDGGSMLTLDDLVLEKYPD